MGKLTELWQTNKWMFFLLVIPLGIAGVYQLLMSANLKGAKKDVEEAEKQDAKLQDDQKEAEVKADVAKEQADAIQDKIDNIKPDEDWQNKL